MAVFGELTMMLQNHKEVESQELYIAEDPHSKAMLEIAKKSAKSNATVLISGETGVGKELVARYIHQHSYHANGPYVSINCAAMPENMIESILFGYEKGAFTDAVTKYIGKFEQANNGTLLLDEISELSVWLQSKLLRVLQERKVERLGGDKLIDVNVRVIAATNRELHKQVALGNFRSDLYYRLNVVPIFCEALRNRPLDIIPLAYHFIEKYSYALEKGKKTLSKNAEKKLLTYSWPGNIRELENVIHRATILTQNEIIDDIDISLTEVNESNADQQTISVSKLQASEAKIILEVLGETKGNRSLAAQKLKISPRTLRYKLAKYKLLGIDVPK